ncbi:MAG: hypothetical protein CM1200mP28_11280 [Deltaproteobacteria bacterium]|nr:MAG: hypothetical protein CM1200mP28_11280 [Deltaproteobacteria bacterium]
MTKKNCVSPDYWDVGEELLLKIPLIKSLYGFFQNKLALSFN